METISSQTKLTNIDCEECPKTEKKMAKMSELPLYTESVICIDGFNIPVILAHGKHPNKPNLVFENREGFEEEKYLTLAVSPYRINRAKIIDWLLDIAKEFELRWETFWCAIEIFDFFVSRKKTIPIKEIQLIAITCLFMSMKIHDSYTSFLDEIIKDTAYKEFSEENVFAMEEKIFQKILQSREKPNYFRTLYTNIHKNCDQYSKNNRIEVLRRLILVWMDPLMSLDISKDKDNEQSKIFNEGTTIYISYKSLTDWISTTIEKEPSPSLENVFNYFNKKYDCENIVKNWEGMYKIKK